MSFHPKQPRIHYVFHNNTVSFPGRVSCACVRVCVCVQGRSFPSPPHFFQQDRLPLNWQQFLITLPYLALRGYLCFLLLFLIIPQQQQQQSTMTTTNRMTMIAPPAPIPYNISIVSTPKMASGNAKKHLSHLKVI